ncbi:MAG: cyclic-di-AMP receptor [Saccharofermentanales bacterium]|jgi:uncharacterized protein YaaQ|nr:hypothetical protein [Oscillospiraceae bacterium]
MKLVFAIVHDEDSPRLMAEMNRIGYRVTKLNSSGGFLRSGNTTLMMVVEEAQQEDVLETIRQYSSSRKAAINTSVTPSSMGGSYIPYPVEVTVGGATVFIVNVEHFEKM